MECGYHRKLLKLIHFKVLFWEHIHTFKILNSDFAEITHRSAYHSNPRPAADAQISRKRMHLLEQDSS